MSRTRIALADGTHWLDVNGPSRAELESIGKEYNLHSTSIQDCLQPEHLPKIERIGDVVFAIMRAYDQESSTDADTLQELTRKVAIFRGKDFIVTVQREEQPFMHELLLRYQATPCLDSAHLISEILKGVARSYEKPIDDATDRIELMETATFKGTAVSSVIEDAYYLHRRSSVVKRVLRMTVGVILQLDGHESTAPYFRDAKDAAEETLFFSDELIEKVKSLIDLHLSLQSHRTNDVMRVLTIFSAFFMPLTFIASIYGMNFRFMPELDSKHGYPIILSIMGITGIGIYTWFKKNGWLKGS